MAPHTVLEDTFYHKRSVRLVSVIKLAAITICSSVYKKLLERTEEQLLSYFICVPHQAISEDILPAFGLGDTLTHRWKYGKALHMGRGHKSKELRKGLPSKVLSTYFFYKEPKSGSQCSK